MDELQRKHELLVESANKILNINIRKRKSSISSSDLDVIEIGDCQQIAIATKFLFNLKSGSGAHHDLYELLKQYMGDPEKRSAINEIIGKL